MKKIDIAVEKARKDDEWLKELIVDCVCPMSFGLKGYKGCNKENDCKKCWEEETEDDVQ